MSTYLQIVNQILEELNETLLTEGKFAGARGLQRFAKTAVNKAYMDILGVSTEWPWLHNTVSRVEGTEVLTLAPGTQWYDFAADEIDVDWYTVYITDKDPETPSTSVPLVSENLEYKPYDAWARDDRPVDNQRTVETRGTPCFVIRHPGAKLGFSPVPDKTYYIEYFVWKPGTSFTLATDLVPFAQEFENVLLSRAMYYMWKQKGNLEFAGMSRGDYKTGVQNMQRILISTQEERMRAV